MRDIILYLQLLQNVRPRPITQSEISHLEETLIKLTHDMTHSLGQMSSFELKSQQNLLPDLVGFGGGIWESHSHLQTETLHMLLQVYHVQQ